MNNKSAGCAVCLFTLSAVLILASCGARQESGNLRPQVQEDLESAVTSELKNYGGKQSVPGAVVGVWIPGQGSFVKAIGFSNLSPQEPMALNDKFRVGSNTKTFVVTVLLQLVDEKKLNLDDPLSKFDIGVKVPNARNITVRELCQMQSGLMNAYDTPEFNKMDITPTTKLDPRELVAMAVKHPPLFAPGKGWNYSNTNYLLLGLIIEAVTHHSVADEIKNRLLVPLGLRDTTFPLSNPAMPLPFSHGYTLDKNGNWEDSTVVLPPSASWAAGVMISDMADMKKWVKAYVTGTTNSAATQRERLTCVTPHGQHGMGFGLGIGCTGGWFGYTGGIPGYNTAVYYLPSKSATIIALVNSQREQPWPGVANSIVRDFTRILFPEHVAYSGLSGNI